MTNTYTKTKNASQNTKKNFHISKNKKNVQLKDKENRMDYKIKNNICRSKNKKQDVQTYKVVEQRIKCINSKNLQFWYAVLGFKKIFKI